MLWLLHVRDLAQGCPLGNRTPHCRSTSTGPVHGQKPGESPYETTVHTFRLGGLWLRFFLLLFLLRPFLRVSVCFALLALAGITVGFLSPCLLCSFVAGSLFAVAAVFIAVAVIVAFAIGIFVCLSGFLFTCSFLSALAGLSRLLFPLGLLLLQLEACGDVSLGSCFEDALLAVFALL